MRHGYRHHGFESRPTLFGPRGLGRGRSGDEWGGEHRGRGRRRLFDSGELRLVLLKLISDQPRHGYDLIRAIEELTGGGYAPSPGVVYPTLTMLQDMGQIEEAKSDGARKAFSITAEGVAHLAAHQAEVEAVFARLAELAATREKTSGAPIRRAMENLRTALRERLTRADVDKNTLHEAAAILDEAAQRIERL